MSTVPIKAYGILEQTTVDSALDEAVEQIRHLGYAVLDAGFSPAEVAHIAAEFDTVRAEYTAKYGLELLQSGNEHNTIRGMCTSGHDTFIKLALNPNLMQLLKRLIKGSFMLNQQNGIVNPAKQAYNQGSWHRDLPYQHFVSTSVLAINALYCVDDFTTANGATYILPASHLREPFPSAQYIARHAVQAEAKAGSFIVLDCMIYHSGGFNSTDKDRRAINHLYNIPFFKQQINLPNSMPEVPSDEVKQMLGYAYVEPQSVDTYIASRVGKK